MLRVAVLRGCRLPGATVRPGKQAKPKDSRDGTCGCVDLISEAARTATNGYEPPAHHRIARPDFFYWVVALVYLACLGFQFVRT